MTMTRIRRPFVNIPTMSPRWRTQVGTTTGDEDLAVLWCIDDVTGKHTTMVGDTAQRSGGFRLAPDLIDNATLDAWSVFGITPWLHHVVEEVRPLGTSGGKPRAASNEWKT